MVSQSDNWNDMTKTSKVHSISRHEIIKGDKRQAAKVTKCEAPRQQIPNGFKVTLLFVYPALGGWPIKNCESNSVGILFFVNSKGRRFD